MNGYRLIFFAVGLIGILLIASRPIAGIIHFPNGEHFSELYLLDADHTAKNYPFNVIEGHNYFFYIGLCNCLGSSAYYILYLKFTNDTSQLPNNRLGTPSDLEPLYEKRFFLLNNGTTETKLSFSFSGTLVSANQALVEKLTLNNATFNVNKYSYWNDNSTGFYYQIFFELWRYNMEFGKIQFDNRFVALRMNLSVT